MDPEDLNFNYTTASSTNHDFEPAAAKTPFFISFYIINQQNSAKKLSFKRTKEPKMPPYWRRYPWRRRRRPWFRYRRPGTTFWRRKRRYRRRKRWVRRKFKLPSIKIRQFQPKTIRFCKIKGIKCLFQGSSFKTLVITTGNTQQPIPPEGRPGGGGWGLLALSLASFYEDYQHLQNIFTASKCRLAISKNIGV